MSKPDNAAVCSTLAELSRTIHEPARLAILTVLASCIRADFTYLQTATGLTKGNLSVQLNRLEEASLIAVNRTIENKRTLTLVSLTDEGRAGLAEYWKQMEALRSHSEIKASKNTRSVRSPRNGGKKLSKSIGMESMVLLAGE